jgi:hypothetical protein
MTETQRKLREAQYFLHTTSQLFNNQSLEFEFHLNAFVNAARNVTFVLQNEYSRAPGFKEWWAGHQIQQDEAAKKFVNLRNVSLKERSVRHKLFSIRQDFGTEGLHVVGLKGPTSVKSDPIRFDGPIPDHGYVTVSDDNGERRVRFEIIHDFSVLETYEHGTKQIKFDNFISDARDHLQKLEQLVAECENNFGSSPISSSK